MATRLLLVEDDRHVADALSSVLELEGYEVSAVGTVAEALSADLTDLILLDLQLPDGDGMEVCRALRERSGVPIIVVSARGAAEERVSGLRGGADDYVVKPFSIDELMARIEGLLRRAGGGETADHTEDDYDFGDIHIDGRAQQVTVAGVAAPLTRKEYELLVFLAANSGRAVARTEILREVWRTTWEGRSRTVDVHVAVLRQKLGHPGIISTVRGVGYRLDPAPADQ